MSSNTPDQRTQDQRDYEKIVENLKMHENRFKEQCQLLNDPNVYLTEQARANAAREAAHTLEAIKQHEQMAREFAELQQHREQAAQERNHEALQVPEKTWDHKHDYDRDR